MDEIQKNDATESLIDEPIEILLNLAKNNEIDPWNIDIIEVTDKYLARIEKMQIMDLRISGRTLFYASIFLRMKSTGIILEDEEEEYELDSIEDEFYDVQEYPIPKFPIRRNAKRPVVLNELIEELKKAEKVESKRKERLYKKYESDDEISHIMMDDILEVAHEEDIMERTKSLNDMFEEIFKKKEVVKFRDILDENSDIFMIYISLLFLATDKKIWIKQETLFGELLIYPTKPTLEMD
ncbi:MAG: segregation/condensation protein A [Methanosarcinaceae archaeon]|nr:segregation/condensation protein A [Methanosarcinaceae archaeon]